MNDPVLQLQAVDLRYDRQVVVRAASLEIPRGQWIALVGPNASGKTTLLRCAGGRLAPATGEARYCGEPVYPLKARSSAVPGYASAPEELPLFLTLRQSLEIHAMAHGIQVPDATHALCRDLGLARHEGELIRHLSLGTRQKLAVVMALQTQPSLLLLDEVFNGLDIRSALTLKRHLRERVERTGMSILLATHALDVVRDYCDELVLIDSGHLVRSWRMDELRGANQAGQLEQLLSDALARAATNQDELKGVKRSYF